MRLSKTVGLAHLAQTAALAPDTCPSLTEEAVRVTDGGTSGAAPLQAWLQMGRWRQPKKTGTLTFEMPVQLLLDGGGSIAAGETENCRP